MFEKLGEELAKIFFVILAFVCGLALQYYVPQSATVGWKALEWAQTIKDKWGDNSYQIRHLVSSPTPSDNSTSHP